MRAYEIVYIFDSQLTDEQIQEKLDRFHQHMTETGGGELGPIDQWGRRQLAFPIRKRTNGFYIVTQFSAPGEALPEFERLLKLDEGLLRYLIVLHEGEPTAPMSIATRSRSEDDDDDDDSDDDGDD
ncbi:MAG TPA: 30S ribosomal protein S6 [Longimicrobiales bacterium]|nr:30S ribosomal protein S6 [Longimicrobiales bacterium]